MIRNRLALGLFIAFTVTPAFSYDGKTSFPLLIWMDSAGINGDVASKVGSLIFPTNKDVVEAISKGISKFKGTDVHVTLNINNDLLTFSPNDLMDKIALTGLKTVQVRTADVKDIYDVESGHSFKGHGYKSIILITNSGTMLFQLDGESVYWYIGDFQKIRLEFPNAIARACPRATLHHITCQDERCGLISK